MSLSTATLASSCRQDPLIFSQFCCLTAAFRLCDHPSDWWATSPTVDELRWELDSWRFCRALVRYLLLLNFFTALCQYFVPSHPRFFGALVLWNSILAPDEILAWTTGYPQLFCRPCKVEDCPAFSTARSGLVAALQCHRWFNRLHLWASRCSWICMTPWVFLSMVWIESSHSIDSRLNLDVSSNKIVWASFHCGLFLVTSSELCPLVRASTATTDKYRLVFPVCLWVVFLTWCGAISAPDPRASFVIHVQTSLVPKRYFCVWRHPPVRQCQIARLRFLWSDNSNFSLVWRSAAWSSGTARPIPHIDWFQRSDGVSPVFSRRAWFWSCTKLTMSLCCLP